MFIYADESGHTGRAIFNKPNEYNLGSILSLFDADETLSSLVFEETKLVQNDTIHANERRVEDNVRFANNIIDCLTASGDWVFSLVTIEKQFVATTKFVDMIFDSGENSAVPGHWYMIEMFRHALCCASDEILTEKNKREFWDAFIAADEIALRQCVRTAKVYLIRLVEDPKLRKIMKDAFDFFLIHTDQFTLGPATGKRAYQGNTPNMIAFSCLIQAINQFAEKHNSPPLSFIHDRQDEFKTSMREWYEIFGPMVHEDDGRGLWPGIRKVLHDLPDLVIAPSGQSPGLQAVDTLLWIERRKSNEPVLKECQSRLRKYSDAFYISRWMSELIVKMRMEEAVNKPFGPQDEMRARKFLTDIEFQRTAQVRALKG